MATKYGMAIDLNKCIGCGTCALACKSENNTEYKKGGTTYNWSDFYVTTLGKYSNGNTSFVVYPTLCNHCTNAACVAVCPVTPKAMYKTDDGITMHNDARCIGCQACQGACPYSSKDVDTDGVQYSVISFNPDGSNTHTFYDDTTELIADGTSSPKETATKAAFTPPNKNDYAHADYNAVRPPKVTEKCYFCDHRIKNGENPFCVDSCPTGARIFGDQNDPSSELSKVLAKNVSKRLKNNNGEFLSDGETGTIPNVYYIGNYGLYDSIKVQETAITLKPLLIYPNPVSEIAQIEYQLEASSKISLAMYDITGRQVMMVIDNQFMNSGKHKIDVNVSNLKAGTYIYRLQTDKDAVTANMVIVR